jgi:hypothetical protein
VISNYLPHILHLGLKANAYNLPFEEIEQEVLSHPDYPSMKSIVDFLKRKEIERALLHKEFMF